jgi:UrcA family protein
MFRSIAPLALAAAIAVAGLQTAAFASPAGQRVAEVETADLDLASPAGQATLDTRLDRAARLVCRAANPRDLREVAASKQCTETARTTAGAMRDQLVARAMERSARTAGTPPKDPSVN